MTNDFDATRYFRTIKKTREGFAACCPRCNDRTFRFYWNVEKQVGCCFHSECQWHTSRGGVSKKRLLAFLGEPGFLPTAPTEVLEPAESLEVSLPKEFQPLEKLHGSLKDSLFYYFRSRGIPRQLAVRAKTGYCESGRMWGYIIFPVFDEKGQVAWWQGRKFKNRDPKFFNPPSQQKGGLLYRVDFPKHPHRLIIVESIFNALTLSCPGTDGSHRVVVIGLLGKTMSDEQREKISFYERSVNTVTVALDPDAHREAVDIATQLTGIFPAVKIAHFPEGEDVNSVGREKAWEVVEKARPFDPRFRMHFLSA